MISLTSFYQSVHYYLFLQIYDSNDLSPLFCMSSEDVNEGWQGGRFVSLDQIIVWTDTGKAYLYQLPAKLVLNDLVLYWTENSLILFYFIHTIVISFSSLQELCSLI